MLYLQKIKTTAPVGHTPTKANLSAQRKRNADMESVNKITTSHPSSMKFGSNPIKSGFESIKKAMGNFFAATFGYAFFYLFLKGFEKKAESKLNPKK